MGTRDFKKEYEAIYRLLLNGVGGIEGEEVKAAIEDENATVEELRDLCLDLFAENMIYKKRIRDLLKGE